VKHRRMRRGLDSPEAESAHAHLNSQSHPPTRPSFDPPSPPISFFSSNIHLHFSHRAPSLVFVCFPPLPFPTTTLASSSASPRPSTTHLKPSPPVASASYLLSSRAARSPPRSIPPSPPLLNTNPRTLYAPTMPSLATLFAALLVGSTAVQARPSLGHHASPDLTELSRLPPVVASLSADGLIETSLNRRDELGPYYGDERGWSRRESPFLVPLHSTCASASRCPAFPFQFQSS
jgi:hypothetical protein